MIPVRKITLLLASALAASLTLSKGQDAPPKVEAFEEPVPSTAPQAGSQFRFTYPVRDATSGQVFTEDKPTTPAEVPSAVSEADIAAGMAMPDPGPEPQPAASPSISTQAADAAFESVGTPGSVTQEESDVGPFRAGRGPLRYSFYVREGYNSNVNGVQNGGVQSMFTSIGAEVAYQFGTSRLKLETSLSAGATFYYNNTGLQNDGIFPTGAFNISAEYEATPRLNLTLQTSTALLAQPDFALVGSPSNYQGNYIVSSTALGAGYRWLPKFETITSYTPVIWYYFEPIGQDFSRLEQTIGQQFLFLWKPTTSLVAEYRLNTRNYWSIDNYNSLGNYALLGFDHTLNPRSILNFRGGVEQRFNQVPDTGGTYNYLGPFAELNFTYALREATSLLLTTRYGTTASGISNYNQGQQFRIGTALDHVFGRRLRANAFIYYLNNYYNQPDNLAPDFYTNIYNAGLGASFAINRVWSLNAGYAYTGLISTDDTQQGTYNQNIVFFGAAANF